jgi:hypothetical protein
VSRLVSAISRRASFRVVGIAPRLVTRLRRERCFPMQGALSPDRGAGLSQCAKGSCLRGCAEAPAPTSQRKAASSPSRASLSARFLHFRGLGGARLGPVWVREPPWFRGKFRESRVGAMGLETAGLQAYSCGSGAARSACHAEGRGFESLQPLRERPAFAGLLVCAVGWCVCVTPDRNRTRGQPTVHSTRTKRLFAGNSGSFDPLTSCGRRRRRSRVRSSGESGFSPDSGVGASRPDRPPRNRLGPERDCHAPPVAPDASSSSIAGAERHPAGVSSSRGSSSASQCAVTAACRLLRVRLRGVADLATGQRAAHCAGHGAPRGPGPVGIGSRRGHGS